MQPTNVHRFSESSSHLSALPEGLQEKSVYMLHLKKKNVEQGEDGHSGLNVRPVDITFTGSDSGKTVTL